MKRFLKKYFIAHHGNDHHPHFFRTHIAFLILLVLVGVELFLLNSITSTGVSSTSRASVIASSLISYTNESRQSAQLPPLNRSTLLDQAAEAKAKDMIAKGYFAHFAPDGTSPWYWIKQTGYQYVSAGENLAIDFVDSKDIVNAWLNSPTHRQNIMKQKYTDIGMAVVSGWYANRQTVFVVQMFGTPKVSTGLIELSTQNTKGASVSGILASIKTEAGKYISSPRSTVEFIMIVVGIIIVCAALLYISTTKSSKAHRTVSAIALGLLIFIALIIMMNRTYLQVSEADFGSAIETSIESE